MLLSASAVVVLKKENLFTVFLCAKMTGLQPCCLEYENFMVFATLGFSQPFGGNVNINKIPK